MRNGKIIIYLITAAFLVIAVFFWLQEPEREVEIPISVSVSSLEDTQQIRCWKNDAGEYYVFLPSYAILSQTRICADKAAKLQMNGLTVTNGMRCDAFGLDTPYDLTYIRNGKTYHFQVTFVQSANLPALYLNVRSGSMDYIHQEKGNKESGSLFLYTSGGERDHADSFEALEGRGNSTWELRKKPYNLKLSNPGNLLGMGAAQKWILLANAYDPSHLRNKIVYDFADRFDLAYSPECQWVDLYLNGEYAGLYLLCERNEVHPQRVDLANAGSFLVSKEYEWRMAAQEQPFLTTAAHAALRIHYTSMDTDTMSAIWQSAENAILAGDGVDPDTGKHWRELIDVDSWARKYLVEEVFGNVDGGTLSQFFYYDGNNENGKIYAGPVWDYDLAMANTVAYPCPAANMFYVNRPDVWGSPWFHALYRNEEFYERVVALYETEFRPLLKELLEYSVEEYGDQIAQGVRMNQIRWASRDAALETENIRIYLTARMAFLDSIWTKKEEYVSVLVNGPEGMLYSYAVRLGDCLPQLPEYEGSAWYDADTDMPIDPEEPLYRNIVIQIKQIDVPVEEETVVEEDLSLLRLGPALVFCGALAVVCLWDRKRGSIDGFLKI